MEGKFPPRYLIDLAVVVSVPIYNFKSPTAAVFVTVNFTATYTPATKLKLFIAAVCLVAVAAAVSHFAYKVGSIKCVALPTFILSI